MASLRRPILSKKRVWCLVFGEDIAAVPRASFDAMRGVATT
jgi:hypothetical protein